MVVYFQLLERSGACSLKLVKGSDVKERGRDEQPATGSVTLDLGRKPELAHIMDFDENFGDFQFVFPRGATRVK
jgi:hypothetical protein